MDGTAPTVIVKLLLDVSIKRLLCKHKILVFASDENGAVGTDIVLATVETRRLEIKPLGVGPPNAPILAFIVPVLDVKVVVPVNELAVELLTYIAIALDVTQTAK